MEKVILAGCAITNDDGAILLIHRNTPGRTQWELPGGKIDDGEEPAVAAVREVSEELGLDVEIVHGLGAQDFKEDGYTLSYIWFLARYDTARQTPKLLEHEKYDDFAFVDVAEALTGSVAHPLSPNAKNLFEAIVAGTVDISRNA